MHTNARRLAILSLLCLSGCASEQAGDEALAALDSFYGAFKRGDATLAMTHVAPDALFVESGRLETRAEYEKNHLPADIGFERQVSGRRISAQVRVEGDTAWVIASTEFEGTFDGNPVHFVSSQLAILTRQEGRWLIRAVHWSSRAP
jgi:ketosteroid isomerase-like protein